MNLIIPIEIKKREFESRILLALTAAERGFDVLLGERSETLWVASEPNSLRGIVHHKSISPASNKKELLSSAKRNGFMNSVQDEESGLLENDYQDFFQKRFDENNIQLADYIFAWGTRDFDYIKSFSQHSKRITRLTGSPRVDLWKTLFDMRYKPEKRRKYILIASNFTTTAGIDSPKEMMDRICFVREKTKIEFLKHILRYQSFQSKTLEKFISFIFELESKLEDYEIIIRPHPVEDPNFWDSLFDGHNNIKVLSKGSITSLVRGAAAVIHNGCTTGIEAFVSRVPAFSFIPYGSWPDSKYADELSIGIENVDEFLQMFFGNIGAPFEDEARMEELRKRVFVDQKRLSADLIVDEFARDFKPFSDGRLRDELRHIRYTNWKRHLGRRLKRSVKLILSKRAFRTSSFKYQDHSVGEVREVVESCSECLKRFQGIRVVGAGPRSVLFFKY